MSLLKHKILKADRRSVLYRDFRDIFESMALLQQRFQSEYEFSPFDFTEQTAVSAFVWAAGTRQRLALAEYQVLKSKKPGAKFKRSGRADLWIDFPDQSYSLEFKVASYQATPVKLRQRFDAARHDASCVDTDEHDYAFGVLVAYVAEDHRIDFYEAFAREPDVRLAARIGKKVEGSCYIFFGDPISKVRKN